MSSRLLDILPYLNMPAVTWSRLNSSPVMEVTGPGCSPQLNSSNTQPNNSRTILSTIEDLHIHHSGRMICNKLGTSWLEPTLQAAAVGEPSLVSISVSWAEGDLHQHLLGSSMTTHTTQHRRPLTTDHACIKNRFITQMFCDFFLFHFGFVTCASTSKDKLCAHRLYLFIFLHFFWNTSVPSSFPHCSKTISRRSSVQQSQWLTEHGTSAHFSFTTRCADTKYLLQPVATLLSLREVKNIVLFKYASFTW